MPSPSKHGEGLGVECYGDSEWSGTTLSEYVPVGCAVAGRVAVERFSGATVSNSGIVPAGPNGAIQGKVNALTHAVFEVAGYFSR